MKLNPPTPNIPLTSVKSVVDTLSNVVCPCTSCESLHVATISASLRPCITILHFSTTLACLTCASTVASCDLSPRSVTIPP